MKLHLSSGPEEAVAAYYQLHGRSSLTLESIELAYMETGPFYQPVAKPVWLIDINGERILLQLMIYLCWRVRA